MGAEIVQIVVGWKRSGTFRISGSPQAVQAAIAWNSNIILSFPGTSSVEAQVVAKGNEIRLTNQRLLQRVRSALSDEIVMHFTARSGKPHLVVLEDYKGVRHEPADGRDRHVRDDPKGLLLVKPRRQVQSVSSELSGLHCFVSFRKGSMREVEYPCIVLMHSQDAKKALKTALRIRRTVKLRKLGKGLPKSESLDVEDDETETDDEIRKRQGTCRVARAYENVECQVNRQVPVPDIIHERSKVGAGLQGFQGNEESDQGNEESDPGNPQVPLSTYKSWLQDSSDILRKRSKPVQKIDKIDLASHKPLTFNSREGSMLAPELISLWNRDNAAEDLDVSSPEKLRACKTPPSKGNDDFLATFSASSLPRDHGDGYYVVGDAGEDATPKLLPMDYPPYHNYDYGTPEFLALDDIPYHGDELGAGCGTPKLADTPVMLSPEPKDPPDKSLFPELEVIELDVPEGSSITNSPGVTINDDGDNMMERSGNLGWYNGPTLLEALDSVVESKRHSDKALLEAEQGDDVGFTTKNVVSDSMDDPVNLPYTTVPDGDSFTELQTKVDRRPVRRDLKFVNGKTEERQDGTDKAHGRVDVLQ